MLAILRTLFVALLVVAWAAQPALAQETPGTAQALPEVVAFQGLLTDDDGTPLDDGAYRLTVRLYDQPEGGTLIWEDEFAVETREGAFSVLLGSNVVLPEPAALTEAGPLFVAVAVDGRAEMTPRAPLTTVPFALYSNRAHRLDPTALEAGTGVTLSEGEEGVLRIDAGEGAFSGVTTNRTLSGDGTDDHPLGLSVYAIRPGANVEVVHTSDGAFEISAVTSDGGLPAVTTDETLEGKGTIDIPLGIAPGGVGNDEIAADAVSANKLADAAVDTGALQDGAVTGAKLDTEAILAGANVTVTRDGADNFVIAANDGFALPYNGTAATPSPTLSVQNTGDGGGAFFVNDGGTGKSNPALSAINTSTDAGLAAHFRTSGTYPSVVIDQEGSGPLFTANNQSGTRFRLTNAGTIESIPVADARGLSTVSSGGNGLLSATILAENTSTDGGVAAWFKATGTDATVVIGNDGTGDLSRGFVDGQLRYRMSNNGTMVTHPVGDVPGFSSVSSGGVGAFSATVYAENTNTGGGIAGWFETKGTDATLVANQDGTGWIFRGFSDSQLRMQVENDGSVFMPQIGNPTETRGSNKANAFQVNGAEGHGFFVGHADDDGFSVPSTNRSGLYVGDADVAGVFVMQAGSNGLYVNHADANGVHVESAGAHGALLMNDGGNGFSTATLVAENASAGNGIAAWLRASGTDATMVAEQNGTGDLFKGFNMGNLRFRVTDDGDVYADGSFNPGGADLAEAFDVEGSAAQYEPGDVLVISAHTNRTVTQSTEAYSTLVAGVYATDPGVLLSPRMEEIGARVPMGVVGVIPTKVTLEGGPIRRGDLLVTSSTPGHAMKADPSRLGFGMVIGKALEPFDGAGTGLIEVLVSIK